MTRFSNDSRVIKDMASLGVIGRDSLSDVQSCPLRKSQISLALSLMLALSVPGLALAQAQGGKGGHGSVGGAGGMAGEDGLAGTGGVKVIYPDGSQAYGQGVGGAGGKAGDINSPNGGNAEEEVITSTEDIRRYNGHANYEDTIKFLGKVFGSGGGGGGGYSNVLNISSVDAPYSLVASYYGGNGGNGGAAKFLKGTYGAGGGGGGGGGAGGDGLHLQNTAGSSEIISGVEISGGNGGAGGMAAEYLLGEGALTYNPSTPEEIKIVFGDNSRGAGGVGGDGGAGGFGLKAYSTELNNSGVVRGGGGGAGGAVGNIKRGGRGGDGGVGIFFKGGSLFNNGKVSAGNGGFSGDMYGVSTNFPVSAPGKGGDGVVFEGVLFSNSGEVVAGSGGGVGLLPDTFLQNGVNFADGKGSGGSGVVFKGEEFRNSGVIKGGVGGVRNYISNNGGDGAVFSEVKKVVNSGQIYGGAAGVSGFPPMYALKSLGLGGVGLRFLQSGVNFVNSGLIEGGVYNTKLHDGIYQDAVIFSGGGNRFEIAHGSEIRGNVVAEASDGAGAPLLNTLVLGGAEDAGLDVSTIGSAAQYRGFSHYEKTGASTWALSGATSSVTPWMVKEGALSVAADASLGDISGALTLNGGALAVTGSDFSRTERAIVLGAQGGKIDIADAQNNFTVSQAVTGAGGLEKAGAGRLTLAASNSYAGATTISAGTLALGAGGSLVATAAVNLASDSARFDISQAASQTIAALTGVSGSVVDLGSNVLTLGDASYQSFAGAINGSGSVVKQGLGTAVLSGSNSYSGGTTISAGTLQLGDGGATGALTGDVSNSGTLAFNRSNESIFAGNISGSGSVSQIGSGTSILTGLNSYTGDTTVASGKLQFGNGNAGAHNTLGGSLNVNAGALAIHMPATVRVAGNVALADDTSLSIASNLGAAPSLDVADTLSLGERVKFNLFGINSAAADKQVLINTGQGISGDFVQVAVGGFVGEVDYMTLSARKSADGKQYLVDYKLAWTEDGANASNTFTLTNPSDKFTVGVALTDQAGSPAGGTNLNKSGRGTLILSADNSYSGGTTISGGTLQLGDGGASGTVVGNVSNDGKLAIKRSDEVIFAGEISGSGAFAQIGTGVTTLTGKNSYSGGTIVAAGKLVSGDEEALVQNTAYTVASGATLDLNSHKLQVSSLSGGGVVVLGTADLTIATDTRTEFGGALEGAGKLIKQGAGTVALNGASTMTGGVDLKQGRIDLGNSQGLGTGQLSMDDGTAIRLTANGLVIANAMHMTGSNDPIIDTGAYDGSWTGAITGAGFLTKLGTGTLTLASDANSYTGATDVAEGSLRAGTVNTFSATSAHSVAKGATLDLAGYNQTLASLANSGTVKLSGAAPGAMLTLTGPYVGHGGNLALSTVLGDSGSVSDKLLLSGAAAVASGSTTVQVINASGLGAQTTGDGIEIIRAENGARLEAGAFSLAGGHVDAGAYEYRLYQNEQMASLQSREALRAEVPLLSALPAQLRQADLAMLGSMHQRSGDAGSSVGNDRRAWGRMLRTDLDIRQQGTVRPQSSGSLTGFQAGLDVYADKNLKVGLYVGELKGNIDVSGFTSAGVNKAVGFNHLQSRYLGFYGSWQAESGLYADAVLQAAQYRSNLHTDQATASTKGSGWLASFEVGQPFALSSQWQIEPQAQLIYRQISLDDTALAGDTQVKHTRPSDWTLRLGARIKGNMTTAAGVLQPYASVNVYRASATSDVARFATAAAATDIEAKGGYLSTALAVGAALQVNQSTSIYGEIGKHWANGGDTRVKSGLQASVGVKVRW